VRKELETKRLQAEVVLPAEAQRTAASLLAEGDAAPRREQGAASAQVMRAMADALKAAGPHARELFVLSQLDTLVAQVANKVKDVQIGQVQVVDGGDGQALPALTASFPQTVVSVLGTLEKLTGVDISRMLGEGGDK
jgi:flotillin